MACPDIITIPKTECIGNSLVTINNNFGSLRSAICQLSAGVAVLKDSEEVGTNVTTFNFVGEGVTVSGTGAANNAVIVNVPKFNPLRVSLLEEQGINSGGGRNNVFILNDGSVRVCGLNSFGELGTGVPDAIFLPRIAGFRPPLEVDETIIRVYTQCHNTYAITSKGRLYGAGYNRHGQVGQGNTNTIVPVFTFINVLGETAIPIDPDTNPRLGYQAATTDPVVRITTGSGGNSNYITIFAVTRSGALYTWGDNSSGQTGLPRVVRNEIITSPKRVGYVGSVAFITSGGNDRRTTTFIKDTAGKLFVCGRNQDGQAGIGTPNVDLTTFQPVVGLPTNYIANNVRCGGTVDNISAWITLTDGTLWAAGYDNNGQVTGLPTGATPLVFYTKQRQTRFGLVSGFIPQNDFVVDVVAHADSNATTCWALLRDGDAFRIVGWGNNRFGALGLGGMSSIGPTGVLPRNPRQTPIVNPNWPWLVRGAKVKQVVVAGNGAQKTTLVLDTNNRLWASGYGGTGLLGRGTLQDSDIFVRVLFNPALGTPVQIRSTNNDSGFSNFLCLLNTGRVLAWGYDSDIGFARTPSQHWYFWWPYWPYWRYDRTGSGQLGVDASPRITAVPSLVQIYV
jgi:alpha-tubulin suppressor-like RCC1 family protein